MQELTACRICKADTFESLVDFGLMAQGGLFPKIGTAAPQLPLHLVKCLSCGLVQLGHQMDVSKLYGSHYGYRSGLNLSMVEHLADIVRKEVPQWVNLTGQDGVLDIGSNDGTLLSFYDRTIRRVGIDPSMDTFRLRYPLSVKTITGFFGEVPIEGPFKVVTSIAMFYDLDDPVAFASQVRQILDDDGVWILEQGYWPELARQGAYDVICHEHLDYYSVQDMIHIMDKAGLVIKAVSFNKVNGASFRLVVGKQGHACGLGFILQHEAAVSMERFQRSVLQHGAMLKATLQEFKQHGKTIYGYGASTKGNTVLQYAGIGHDLLDCILDVSEAKAGCWTPGTQIPIVMDAPLPDYYLVLPWHYRESILLRERTFLEQGGSFIFPLPEIEVVSKKGAVIHGQ